MLPAIQSLITAEANGYQRSSKRPRCLVLVPTRELARQVLSVIKSLSHYAKVSSCAVLGKVDNMKFILYILKFILYI